MEHLTLETISRYRQRQLSAEERLQASDHLAACEECRQRVREAKPTLAMVSAASSAPQFSAPETEHLPYEEIAAYVDGAAHPAVKEIVEEHTRRCAMCRAEVDELRAFRAVLSTYPTEPVAPPTSFSWRETLAAFFSNAKFRTGLQLAGGVAVGALAMLLFVKRPPIPTPPTDNKGALEVAQRAQREAEEKTQQIQVALNKEQETLRAAQQRLSGVEKEAADWKAKASKITPQQVAEAGQILTGKDGKPLLTVPVGAEENRAVSERKLALPTQQIAQLTGTRVQMGGGDEEKSLKLIRPMGTYMATLRPTLRWKTYPNAVRYEVRVIDKETDTVSAKGVVPAELTAWTVAENTPLAPGKTYRWTVTALDAEGEVIARPPAKLEARFRTLDSAAMTEAQSKQSLYANAPLLLAAYQARLGLVEDAQATLEQYLQRKPNDSTARQLLTQLQAVRQPQKSP